MRTPVHRQVIARVTQLEKAQQSEFEPRGHAPSHPGILPNCSRRVKRSGSRGRHIAWAWVLGPLPWGSVTLVNLLPCASVVLLCKMGLITASPRTELSASLASLDSSVSGSQKGSDAWRPL